MYPLKYSLNAFVTLFGVSNKPSLVGSSPIQANIVLKGTRVDGVYDNDPEKVKKVYDTWRFSRNLNSNDPNWILVETNI